MVDCDYNDVAFLCQGAPFVAGEVDARPRGESTTVEPHKHGALLAVVQSLCPHIQHQASCLVHGFKLELESEVVIALLVPVQTECLALRGFRPIDAAHFHALVCLGFVRWHKAFSFGVTDAFECVDVTILVTLYFAIHSVGDGAWARDAWLHALCLCCGKHCRERCNGQEVFAEMFHDCIVVNDGT